MRNSYFDSIEPPHQYLEVVPMIGEWSPTRKPETVTINIVTSKLPGAPYWLYQAYMQGLRMPILQLISRPGGYQLRDAIIRARTRKGDPE